MRGLVVYASEAGGGLPLHIELVHSHGVSRRPKQPVRVRQTKCQRANTCDKHDSHHSRYLCFLSVCARELRSTNLGSPVRITCDCGLGITHLNRCDSSHISGTSRGVVWPTDQGFGLTGQARYPACQAGWLW